MKKNLLLGILSLLLSTHLLGQARQVTGFWVTEDGDSQIEIFQKADGQFYGRIVWLDEPLNDQGRPKLDDKNPDRSLQNQPLTGLEILKGFSYNAGKKEWAGGTIYDPKNGRTYSSYFWLDGNNTLKLKGYVMGMRFLGRETTWTREAAKRS